MIPATVQFPCPHCRRVIRTVAAMGGQAVACPGCERRAEVPAAPKPAESVSDSSMGATRSPLYRPPAG